MRERAAPREGIPYDVVVIGAGINGLGIARDAALRGLRVIVLEAEDICSGTSAWSGRLVHGGLRYLERLDIGLVRESLRERELLFRLAPHLVKPVNVMMPLYVHSRRPAWMTRLGMVAYDVLSYDKKTPRHRMLTKEETVRRFPGMATSGLTGAAVFTDGQVEYAERLCVELAVAAASDGADILTHARVLEPIVNGDTVVGVRYIDTTTDVVGEFRARIVLNVTGPWIDRVFQGSVPPQARLNGGTKGSHIVVDPFPGAPVDVVYFESRRDGRLVLVIPWLNRYLIGTTDLRFDGDPSESRASLDEVDYLLGEANSLIPSARLTHESVLFTYSGVRPLPYAPGTPESRVPRGHVLHDHARTGLRNLLTVVGGKLTTYRRLAEDVVDDVFRRLERPSPKCVTAALLLPGARAVDPEALAAELAESTLLDESSARRLVGLYGSRAVQILSLIDTQPDLATPVDGAGGLVAAELIFGIESEFAVTLTDLLARRTLTAFCGDHAVPALDAILSVLGRYGWTRERCAREREAYLSWLDRLRVPTGDGIAVAGSEYAGAGR